MNKSFENQAQDILKTIINSRKEGKSKKPFVIEITGTPNSGKTSIITALTRFFKRNGWRVLNPIEGAESIKRIPRSTYLYNIRTGIYALAELLDNCYSLDFDLVILDRGIYDAFCWQEYWRKKKSISQKTAEINKNFFTQLKIGEKIDLCFFLVCKEDEAVRRELKTTLALTKKTGHTTNPEMIKILLNVWRDSYQKIRKNRKDIHFMDTSLLSKQEVGVKILDCALSSMKAWAKN